MNPALPLKGVRVVDLTRVYSGPYCTFLMARAGAEGIKIEPPEGDSVRKRDGAGGANLPFALLNANKTLMTLDMKAPGAAEVLDRLLATADVLVENFRPGVLSRLGLTPERLAAINPRLIVARNSGYGQSGLYRDFLAMDLTVQAAAGIIDATGFADGPPVKAGPQIVDFLAGTHLYGAIVTALRHRDLTGEVLSPDISMMDAAVPSLMSNIAAAWANRDDPGFVSRTGSRHGGMSLAPYNIYPAADGYVAIIAVTEKHWLATAKVLGREDMLTDPRFATLRLRCDNMDAFDEELGRETVKHGRETLRRMLSDNGAVCAPVMTLAEVLADPHLHDRGMLHPIDHPTYGQIVVMGTPLRFAGKDPAPYAPSRALGEDNDRILTSLGFTETEIARLHSDAVL